ncbi:bifunctional biotin--[acetyl-CoA-carboxylase] ligase/biotin operon repressor BirA [Stutzerimonas tarimensis]|uniref:Bifunctional ligase/repressor BirA n=1 Tax=Stutzerimonas tarimensis TaxID=1507735 RepID=A0ABV7T3Q9_9GAMM
MDKSLLCLLSDGQFHSGQELGTLLGVGRSAVWKQLRRLESDTGIELHRVPGKGYRLASPLSLLDGERMAPALQELGWAWQLHDQVDSTNTQCLRSLSGCDSMPLLVLAEGQSAGRGRRGRAWVSPSYHNLYLSLGLRLEQGAHKLSGLSLVAGLAVLQGIRKFGLTSAGLKWPNDILVRGRKLAGVLLELTGDPSDVCHVVIGVGVNVNMLTAPDVDQAWTSLRIETGSVVDRTKLALELAASLEAYLARHTALGFEALREEWQAHHLWQGKVCDLHSPTRTTRGIVDGIAADGALRMLVEGREQFFSAGELSLRLTNDS